MAENAHIVLLSIQFPGVVPSPSPLQPVNCVSPLYLVIEKVKVFHSSAEKCKQHFQEYIAPGFSPESESYWGSYFKYRKRRLCAPLWGLGCLCRCRVPLQDACRMFVDVCVLDFGRWRRCLCVPEVYGHVRQCALWGLDAGAAAGCHCQITSMLTKEVLVLTASLFVCVCNPWNQREPLGLEQGGTGGPYTCAQRSSLR